MSNTIGSINNQTFTQHAIKYLQGQEIEEQSTGQEILSGIPSQLAFGTVFEVVPAVSKAIKYKGIKNEVNQGVKYGVKDVFSKECKDEFANLCTGLTKNETTKNLVKEVAEKKAMNSWKTKLKGRVVEFFGRGTKAEVIEQAGKKAGEKAVESVSKKVGEKAAGKTILKGILGEAKGFFLFNMLLQIKDILPAFKEGGLAKGIIQTAKSAVFAGCDAVAFTAGAKLGASIGTAVGGPVGAVVGGVVGLVLGGIASSLAEKGAKKIVGKSYTEEKEEAEAKSQTQAIAQDDASVKELMTAVEEKLEEEQASGKISKDGQKILAEMNELKARESNQLVFKALQDNQTAQTNAQNSTNPIFQPTYNTAPNLGTTIPNYQTTPQTYVASNTNQSLNIANAASGVNQGVRTNILNQQANGIYELNNIPRNPDGTIDHSIYQFKPNMLQA